MKLPMLAGVILLTTGCASMLDVKHPYYICYHGEKKHKYCEDAALPDGDEKVCIDLVKDVEFDEHNCNKYVGRTNGSLWW